MSSEDEIAAAAEVIKNSGLVVFPTETVYGLGANALDAAAVEKIYQVKGRPVSSPLIVHVADIQMAKFAAGEWPAIAQTLAERFWPGPLTLIVKKSAVIPSIVTADLPSVGVRAPSHKLALALICQAGVPIAAPSANRFTELSPTTAQHVRESLGEFDGMVLDGGPTSVGIESTVVSLTRDKPVVLRPGMVTTAQLEAATGIEWQINAEKADPREAPGLHDRHYAPRTPFYLMGPSENVPAGRGRMIQMPADVREYAATLYATLHRADKEGWDWIAVARPPATPEWLAIIDRLTRAASPAR